MREIKIGQIDVLFFDILPDIHFRPIGEWEDPEVLAMVLAAIKYIPKFRALVLRVPLAKIITVGKEALFGSCFFLVSATATECRIKLMLLDAI